MNLEYTLTLNRIVTSYHQDCVLRQIIALFRKNQHFNTSNTRDSDCTETEKSSALQSLGNDASPHTLKLKILNKTATFWLIQHSSTKYDVHRYLCAHRHLAGAKRFQSIWYLNSNKRKKSLHHIPSGAITCNYNKTSH